MFGKDEKKRLEMLDYKLRELTTNFKNTTKDLENQIKLKTSDHEKDAKQASKKAAEFRNRASEAKETTENHLQLVSAKKDESLKNAEEIKESLNSVNELKDEIYSLHKTILQLHDESSQAKSSTDIDLENLKEILSEYESLNSQIEDSKEKLILATSNFNKINSLLNLSSIKKGEIDGLYDGIFGYHVQAIGEDGELDENDSPTYIEGLKDELEKSYTSIKSSIDALKENQNENMTMVNQAYESSIMALKIKFKTLINDSKSTFNSTHKKIEKLLPNALTAGLSYAYAEKKKDEENSQKILSSNFNKAIGILFSISLIPFAVDIYLLIKGEDLVNVIRETPSLIVSILPLYFPILWLAFSSNKKLNLSKRLIEEYTHKEVLTKTYEGLSSQIDDISQQDISQELRAKLLFNILEISAENPGKLITDYDKSDHPLMEALESTAKLANSVEKLGKIPGFSALAKNLDKKASSVFKVADDRSSAILNTELAEKNTKLDPEISEIDINKNEESLEEKTKE